MLPQYLEHRVYAPAVHELQSEVHAAFIVESAIKSDLRSLTDNLNYQVRRLLLKQRL